MTCSSADPAPATGPGDAAGSRSRVLRVVAASLVAAGALLGASTTEPDATSALLTDTESVVTTVRTAPDFGAPRRATTPVPAPATAPPAPAPAPAPASAGDPAPSREDGRAPREDGRAPREDRGR